MNHLQVYRLETAVSPIEYGWINWSKEVEAFLGHSLDGDQKTDGYSLDYAYDLFMQGWQPRLVALEIQAHTLGSKSL